MCVRDFIRRRCQTSKKTLKTKLRHSNRGGNNVLCKTSASRESRSQTLKLEAVDLFCPEFLPMLDPQYCEPDAAEESELSRDDLLVLPVTANSAACAVTLSERSPSDHDMSDDIDNKSQFPRLGPCNNRRSAYVADAVVWNNVSPNRGSQPDHELGPVTGVDVSRESETCIFLGSSRQSNFHPREGWPILPRGLFGRGYYEERALSPSLPTRRRKTYVNDEKTNMINTSQMRTPSEPIQAPGEYACTFKFREVVRILLERETESCYQLPKPYLEKLTENSVQKFPHNELRGARRRIVKWIFEVVRLLHLSSLAAAHAVSILDRYLSQSLFPAPQDEANTDIRLAATACIWIAAKLEDSDAPDLSSIQGLSSFDYDEEKIREMEVSVLKCLGWRMLAATACEFLANMVAQLPAFGLPSHLVRPVGYRSEEIIQGILSEVEFLAYQPSVVSISVMQCLLDECVPVHTASIMAAFHLALAVDVESEKVCHRTLVDLVVDPDLVCSLPSPVYCANSENVRKGSFQWTSSNHDNFSYPLPVSAL